MKDYIFKPFIEKHGKNVFENIRKVMQEELISANAAEVSDDKYIKYIFEIATYMFCNVQNIKIPIMIEKMTDSKYSPKSNIETLQIIHKTSINSIIKYLENDTNIQYKK